MLLKIALVLALLAPLTVAAPLVAAEFSTRANAALERFGTGLIGLCSGLWVIALVVGALGWWR